MAIVDDVFKGPNLWVSLSIAIAAPIVLPVVGSVVRPLAKAAIRGGLTVADVATPMIKGAAVQAGQCLFWPWGQLAALVSEARQEHDAAAAARIIRQKQKTESAASAEISEYHAAVAHEREQAGSETRDVKATDGERESLAGVGEIVLEHESLETAAAESAVKPPKPRKTPARSAARRPKRRPDERS